MPLDWDRPQGRTIGLAVIRHLASNPEQRIGSMFINPGGPGQSGVGIGERYWQRLGRLGRWPIRCRELGSARHERQHADALFPKRGERGQILEGCNDPDDEGAIHVLQSQVRCFGAALREGQRLAAASHLHSRHRSRPRPPERPRRRPQADLRGVVLRHHARADLREHVPTTGQGDVARRRSGRGAVLAWR